MPEMRATLATAHLTAGVVLALAEKPPFPNCGELKAEERHGRRLSRRLAR
jgi:hypothetical protein